MLGLGSIGYVQSFQYVLINIEPVRPSDYSQFVFLALCVFDFDIPDLDYGDVLYHIPIKICEFRSSNTLPSIIEKIELVQYSAALAAMGA